MRRRLIIAGVLIITMMLVIEACAPASQSETETPAKAPEDMIPLTVPDFNFTEKSDRVEPLFEGEEYSAVSFFMPKSNSKFDSKVDHLTVNVHLFKDDTSSNKMTNLLLIGASTTEIQIGERKATLAYKENNGETIVFHQQGTLVIYSLSAPPFEATTFDEEALKEAAIEGFKAVRF